MWPCSATLLIAGVAAFVQQNPGVPTGVWRLNEFKRTTGYGVRLQAETESAEVLMAKAAKLREEIAAAEDSTPSPSPSLAADDAKAKITAALKRATQLRDKDQLQIALSAAAEAGFTSDDNMVKEAIIAFNELNDLSDSMRKRLVAEARSQGGDPAVNWNPGFAYLGVFGIMAVLVVLGGKGIFF